MKSLLKLIFDELFVKQKVKNQFEFGEKLEYDSGYISRLMKEGLIPAKMQKKLHEIFGISREWLATEGKKGTMFDEDTPLTLADFLRQYQEGISKPGGATLTRRELAAMLGAEIGADNIVKWEHRGTIPREETHRQALREFFGIEDLNAPTNEELENAIKCYPNSVKNNAQNNNNQLNTLDNPSPKQGGTTMQERLLRLLEEASTSHGELTRAHLMIASTLERMVPEKRNEEDLKRKAS